MTTHRTRLPSEFTWSAELPIHPADAEEAMKTLGIKLNPELAEQAARKFMEANGLTPTPDAIAQLNSVFLKCLRIMCERPWDANGGTWRRSGVLGILGDVRKKFERLWERGWTRGVRHDDSGYDLINFVGFYLRSDDNRWNEWGEPGKEEAS